MMNRCRYRRCDAARDAGLSTRGSLPIRNLRFQKPARAYDRGIRLTGAQLTRILGQAALVTCDVNGLAAEDAYTTTTPVGYPHTADYRSEAPDSAQRRRASHCGGRGSARPGALASGVQNAIVMKRNASMNTRVLIAPTTKKAITARVSFFSDIVNPLLWQLTHAPRHATHRYVSCSRGVQDASHRPHSPFCVSAPQHRDRCMTMYCYASLPISETSADITRPDL